MAVDREIAAISKPIESHFFRDAMQSEASLGQNNHGIWTRIPIAEIIRGLPPTHNVFVHRNRCKDAN